ncbi:MAG: hypothetical protein JSV03_12170, partial [Planctomycetota bacterium]
MNSLLSSKLFHHVIFIPTCLVFLLPASCDKQGIAGRKPTKIFGEKGMGPGQFVYPRALDVGP